MKPFKIERKKKITLNKQTALKKKDSTPNQKFWLYFATRNFWLTQPELWLLHQNSD